MYNANPRNRVTEQKMDNPVIYNLQGVRLSELQKGINIVNGHKIIVK